MNKFILCLLFLFTGIVATSQKVYFVYIQSEADQPFFVKMNEKVSSSTASGYIILSKLRDTSYNFSIGFPQNKWPEQNFSIAVNKNDHGYVLKNLGEKGWGLFDLQTLAIQMSLTETKKVETVAKPDNKDVSAFTDILSKAADDPSLKEKPVLPKAEEKKPETIIQEIAKKEEPKAEVKEPLVIKPAQIDSPVIKKEEPKAEIKEPIVTKPVEVIEQPIVKDEIKTVPAEEYKKSVITKKSESSTTEGFGLVFLDDHHNGVKDTIRLLIPNPKSIIPVVKEESKEEKKFLDIIAETPKTKQKKEQMIESPVEKKGEPVMQVKEPIEVKPEKNEVPVVKSTIKNKCIGIADESDFFKLRKKMAAAKSDDDMISEANKNFKIKCFTVQQVKNLAALFLNDAGKYKFFDAAYTFVSDIENFSSLQAELNDEYYINRFKAMLRN